MTNETTTTAAPEPSTHANDYLGKQYNGANSLYRYMLDIVITRGAADLAEVTKGFWFLDVICSHQLTRKVRSEPFQVWKIQKNKTTDGCKIICEDGNKNVVVTQAIPYTDFPYQTADLWLIDKVIMLPAEY